MNAIDYLVKHHRQIEDRLERLLEAEAGQRASLFGPTADALVAHVTIEEKIFYPAVKAQRTEDILLGSLEEHLSIKRVLADLLALSPEDATFEAKLHVLKEQVEHHHEEEEENLFPKVKKLFDEPALEKLGQQLESADAALLKGKPRSRVLDQTEAAAEL
jgi:hemerythrin superfamily protein